MSDPISTFRTEAEEHLAVLEDTLLEMEQQPDDPELIALTFRAMHTIKGASGMVGFNQLSEFTHQLETALDKVRNGRYSVTPELISVLLDAKDYIEGRLQEPEQTPEQALIGESLLVRLHTIIPKADESKENSSTTVSDNKEASSTEAVFRIRFTPNQSAFTDGFSALPILKELHALGNCYVTTNHKDVPQFNDLDPESCHLSWDIILVTDQSINTINDIFIFVADDWQISIAPIDLDETDEEHSDRLGEILIERGLLTAVQVKQALEEKPKIGDLLRQAGLVSESDIDAALLEQKAIRETRDRKTQSNQDPIVRVPASRLDKLMNLVGELVIVQARMHQLSHLRDDEDMMSVSEDLDLLTTELRDNTFSIRMLPIGTTFGRFRRLVRDLSRELGKEIHLQTEGAETELDKMVIDKLADPMVHLIRNSIDHGIEAPEQREAAGKKRLGTIHLSAEHAESHVIIRIKDDGAGLNTETIREKAIDRGLVNKEASLSDDEIQQLIFEPGFSTATQVSDVSGRGVGMDVVKRSIQELGGNVVIHSENGEGTTITINLPMTLAIIEGLMVEVAEEHYVLPLSAVEECIEMRRDTEVTQDGKRLVKVRGELVPYMRLREWFEVTEEPPAIEQVVVTRLGEDHFGFCVDEVIGQYQTVIKRLGKLYEGTTGFAGATILGDGSVAMILDAAGLMNAVENEVRV